jgi:uncharacterized protein
MQGQFFWYDIMTTDTRAAARFYAEVVGWGIQRADASGKEYSVFTVNGQGVAGLMPIPDEAAEQGARPGWMGYIAADDVDAAAAKLQKEGGTVHREPEIVPGIIRFAVVSDPQGAAFYLARGLSAEAPSPLPFGTPGTIGCASCTLPTGRLPGPSMKRFLAGRRPMPWTGERWGSTNSSRPEQSP